jgi:hypothetical protein
MLVSVERVARKDGSVVWRVRWRQGGRNRSKVLGRKRDAEAFDAEITRRKRTGELAQLDAGKEPLARFGEEWWRLYAEPNLAPSTLQVYAVQWDAHILPRLGGVPLRELSPDVINRFRLELEADGVGAASIRKALTLLQGVLQRACEWGRLASNPVMPVRKPPVGRTRAVVPLAPDIVEAIRNRLLRRRLVRDATLVSLLAYGVGGRVGRGWLSRPAAGPLVSRSGSRISPLAREGFPCCTSRGSASAAGPSWRPAGASSTAVNRCITEGRRDLRQLEHAREHPTTPSSA